MFSKSVALFVASAFALSAMAAPGIGYGNGPAGGNPPPPPPSTSTPAPTGSQCNVGQMHCCNSVQDSKSETAQNLLGLLGVAAGSVTGQVGLGCVAGGVLGAAGNSCTAQPVCCTGNSMKGLVVVGCSPINVNA